MSLMGRVKNLVKSANDAVTVRSKFANIHNSLHYTALQHEILGHINICFDPQMTEIAGEYFLQAQTHNQKIEG